MRDRKDVDMDDRGVKELGGLEGGKLYSDYAVCEKNLPLIK